ncbi:acyl-CoA thioesterase [Cryptosporangium aurantiacum]|uniref:Acyl-CoA thioester hydrolase n=1 Tax=Cryptosporangium aurantiacum TaxID=134849 RepID=A0A1M7PHK7_9ACTN|nr:acyl-CoA thioesterase [Cryptosporangium aurantiacum]SHN16598.1 acyl-CoA thioester hydrolase [Cryptosporangium aurantiacum]
MSEQRHASERREVWRYPFQHEIHARYGDMDSFQHVNNVAIARFHEDARVAFLRSLFGVEIALRSGEYHFLVAEVRVTYLAEVAYPGAYRIGVGVGRIGRSSIVLNSGLFQGDECLGLCDTVQVNMDHAGPTALPEERRRLLETVRFAAAVPQPAV